jgi:hypothetical protein
MDPACSRRLATVFVLVASIFASACATRTVTFTVTRAASINLRSTGNTVTVGTIAPNGHPEAANQIAADLAVRIEYSLNPSIRLVANGGVIITGSVVVDRYDERTETVSSSCSKTVDDGVDANGVSQSHTESYDCSYDQQVGTGTSVVRLGVFEAGGDHREIFESLYKHSDEVVSPSSGDPARLLHGLRAASVAAFAHVILPWRELVTERFKDCGGDDLCKQAFEAISNGDLARADALYSIVIGGFEVPGKRLPPGQHERISEALYNRAVTRAYLGRAAEASADLARAIAIEPRKAKWSRKLGAIEAMARDQRALVEQGVFRPPIVAR